MWNVKYKQEDVAAIVQKYIMPLIKSGAIFALYGPLGAGKTTLIRECLRQMGITCLVTSPTFSYLNEYVRKGHIPVYHFDLYRISSEEIFYSMGFGEITEKPSSVIFIEWPEIIFNLLDRISVYRIVYKIRIDYDENSLQYRQISCKLG